MKKQEVNTKIFASRFSELLKESDENTHTLAKKLGLSPATISRYSNGIMAPKLPTLYAMADIFNVNPVWLFGYDAQKHTENLSSNLKSPNITEEVVTFPVIGEIAAGYEHIAIEDWSGDTIDVPTSYLKGRKSEEFFVLSVCGDSMYPHYQDGDKVLILKQSTLNRSGEIGAIIYNNECATLKKIEFVSGEDWLEMIPLNPEYKPKRIEGSDLELCRVIGIPKLLIREV